MCYRQTCRVWMHTALNTHRFKDAHSYISINTVPSCSPCAELLIASPILICQIPLGSYHWRVSLRVKNTMLSSRVPSQPPPPPRFKNSSGSNRPLCFIPPCWVPQSEKPCQWSTDPDVSVSLPSQCQKLGFYSKDQKHRRMFTSTFWCQWWDVNSGDGNQMVE